MGGMRGFAALALALSVSAVACGDDSDADLPPTSTSAGSSTSAAPGPVLGVGVSSPGGPAAGPVPVTVTLTNLSVSEVTVVRPFFTATLVSFRVVGPDGEPVPFDGPYADLATLDSGAFVTLAPGESVSDDFDLADHFMLPRGASQVTAEYRNPTGGSFGGEAGLQFDAGSGPVSVPITIEVTE